MVGSLTPEELSSLSISKKHKDIKYFVETGTYKADTTLLVAPVYEHVYTTEIHEGLYQASKERAAQAGVKNITFLHGDSIELLREITPKVVDGAVFFLDAHISGCDSGWNGKNRVPIYEELDVILPHKLGPSVFILDDLRLWKQSVWDWAHITNEKIVQKFTEHGYTVVAFYEKNDRFYILTG